MKPGPPWYFSYGWMLEGQNTISNAVHQQQLHEEVFIASLNCSLYKTISRNLLVKYQFLMYFSINIMLKITCKLLYRPNNVTKSSFNRHQAETCKL